MTNVTVCEEFIREVVNLRRDAARAYFSVARIELRKDVFDAVGWYIRSLDPRVGLYGDERDYSRVPDNMTLYGIPLVRAEQREPCEIYFSRIT